MPLSADDRAALLELVPALGDDADPRAVHAFARAHRQELLDELGAVPGMDQIRAVAVRLLPVLEPEDEARVAWLDAAASALMVPPGDHPAERMARHPAWIGLCLLELADLRDSWDGDPIDRAIEVSGRAFEAAGPAEDVGEGEVAWAMAEQADEAGWSSRAWDLLEAALERPFRSPERAAEARLVAAIRTDERGGDPRALLARVVADEDAAPRTRTHAAWVLAHVEHREGSLALAIAALDSALRTVDAESDPEVARRIRETRDSWL